MGDGGAAGQRIGQLGCGLLFAVPGRTVLFEQHDLLVGCKPEPYRHGDDGQENNGDGRPDIDFGFALGCRFDRLLAGRKRGLARRAVEIIDAIGRFEGLAQVFADRIHGHGEVDPERFGVGSAEQIEVETAGKGRRVPVLDVLEICLGNLEFCGEIGQGEVAPLAFQLQQLTQFNMNFAHNLLHTA